jgi:hypothetical protein
MRKRSPALTVLLLILLLLRAGPAASQAPAEAATLHMSYTGSAIGLDVMKLQATLSMDRAGYRIRASFRTVGLLSTFVQSEQHMTVWGAWREGQPEPQRFWSWGHLRGQPRETLIDYLNGQPVVRTLVPPGEDEREAVPEQQRGDSIDTLSAIAFLVRRVADTGTCDGRARVFDGRRLTEISARTAGPARTSAGESGPYEGDALRCDFTGHQLAGFLLDGSGWQRQPHDGAAWIARVVPGGPPIPVRLTFETRWVGEVAMVLTDAGPGPLPEGAR